MTIFLLGVVVTVVPLVLTMLFGRYVLRYNNAAILAGALTGHAVPIRHSAACSTRRKAPCRPCRSRSPMRLRTSR
jgi:Predicted permease